MDIVYIIITLGFFAAAVGYVRACAVLGREDTADGRGVNVD